MRRDRAALATDDSRFLLRRAADELLARLDLVARPFGAALDLGCGDSYLADRLRARGLTVTAVDAGARFAERAGGRQEDEDRLPFSASSFDLAVSVGAFDTVNDLPGALVQVRRALRPDGLLLAAFAGAGSLPRLRESLRAAEAAEGLGASPRLHPQIDVRAAGDLLTRAGFALPVADTDRVEVRYPGLSALIADLRGMAATNILVSRARRRIRRRHGQAAHLLECRPAQRRRVERLRFARPAMAEVKEQDHPPASHFGAGETGGPKFGHVQPDPQLLLDLANQCRLGRFTRLDFAAGEFPESGHRASGRPLLQQNPVRAVDKCDRDHGHCRIFLQNDRSR